MSKFTKAADKVLRISTLTEPVRSNYTKSSELLTSLWGRVQRGRKAQLAQKNKKVTYEQWIQQNINASRGEIKDYASLNDKLENMIYMRAGMGLYASIFFFILVLIWGGFLIYKPSVLLGIMGLFWVLIFVIVLLQMRFQVWWLSRRISNVTFTYWLKHHVADPIFPADYKYVPYTEGFTFPVQKAEPKVEIKAEPTQEPEAAPDISETPS